jgi:hypothetical protein
MQNHDKLILKVPQAICAKKYWQGGKQVENPNYLNAEMFINQFYDPANAILGDNLAAFIFEQEYQRKADRISPKKYVEELDDFLGKLPKDKRYHIETRTDSYHIKEYFETLDKQGVGNVLSHWTWLPPLRKQFLKADRMFCNSGKKFVIRLLTPLRMNFNESYAKTFPFDKLVPDLLNPEMISETVEIMKKGIKAGVDVYLIINNRICGNAPLVAKEIAEKI